MAVNRNLSNCEIAPKKVFRGFNGIRTRGLCVSAAVLYQLELWRPIHPIFLASTFHIRKTNLCKAKHVLESQYGCHFNEQNKVEGTQICQRKLPVRFFSPF